MKRPAAKNIYIIVATALIWALFGWILISLRNASDAGQLETSTLLLRILCAGASLLLLATCVVASIEMQRLARDAESEQRFPPAADLQWRSFAAGEGEQAWLIAARLRGWAAFALAFGVLGAGIGVGISTRVPGPVVMPKPQPAPIISAAGLVADRQSAHRQTPGRSIAAPG